MAGGPIARRRTLPNVVRRLFGNNRMFLAQTTQPVDGPLPAWAIATLATIAGVVAVLTAVRMTVVPLARDIIRQVVEAMAEAKAASAKSEAAQQSLDRVANGLHATQQSIANVAAQMPPPGDKQ